MGWIMFPHNPQRVGRSLATEQQRNSHVKVLNPSTSDCATVGDRVMNVM